MSFIIFLPFFVLGLAVPLLSEEYIPANFVWDTFISAWLPQNLASLSTRPKLEQIERLFSSSSSSSSSSFSSPLLSIIIVSYERLSELREALHSAAFQDYSNLEIVLVDDQSSSLDFQNYLNDSELLKQDCNGRKCVVVRNEENLYLAGLPFFFSFCLPTKFLSS